MLKFVIKDDIVIIRSDDNKKVKNVRLNKVHDTFEVSVKNFKESDYREVR